MRPSTATAAAANTAASRLSRYQGAVGDAEGPRGEGRSLGDGSLVGPGWSRGFVSLFCLFLLAVGFPVGVTFVGGPTG